MFVSFPELFLVSIGMTLLCVWIIQGLKAKIIQEKRTSFSYVLGVVTESCLILDANARINWAATRLGSIRGNISREVFVGMVRAASLLYAVRISINRQRGDSSVAPLDVGGEYLRFLGVQVAGAGQPLGHELANAALSLCKGTSDNLPLNEFFGVLENDERFTKAGQAVFTSQDLHASQLILERSLTDLYSQAMTIKLFKK